MLFTHLFVKLSMLWSKKPWQMQYSAYPWVLKKKAKTLATHSLWLTAPIPCTQRKNKLTNTSSTRGHNIDETQQVPHVFKLCPTNPCTTAKAIFVSSDTAGSAGGNIHSFLSTLGNISPSKEQLEPEAQQVFFIPYTLRPQFFQKQSVKSANILPKT